MNQPKVTALVSTPDRWETLKKCLANVVRQDWPNLEVVVVENGRLEATPALVAEAFPGATILTLSTELGPAGLVNAAVEKTNGDYVALISGSVYVPTNFVSRIVAVMEAHSDVALVGPSLYNLRLNIAFDPYSDGPSLVGTRTHGMFKDEHGRASPVFDTVDSALMFRRAKVGLPFDPDYHYFSDVTYLAWRTRLRGYEVLREPDIVVKSIHGSDETNPRDDDRFHLERSRRAHFLTLFSTSMRLRAWPLMLLTRGLERLIDWKHGRSWESSRRARRWIRQHRNLIRAKRKQRQAERRVRDSRIICLMSGKVTNARGLAGRLLNALSLSYCRLARVSVWELNGHRRPQRRWRSQ